MEPSRILVDLRNSVLSSAFYEALSASTFATPHDTPDTPPAASGNRTAVQPAPPMPVYMQAAFAAEYDTGALRHDAGYDDVIASLQTSWELEGRAAQSKAWQPAASAFQSGASSSAVRAAPQPPALVAAAVTERYQSSRTASAPLSSLSQTWSSISSLQPLSWELESGLLRNNGFSSANLGTTLHLRRP